VTAGLAVETQALRKVYRDQVALGGVSLHVQKGSVYGLVGPNGSGKTTLLSILIGLRRASSGSFRIATHAQRLALLPDTPNFEPWLTAFEVVDLARTLVAPQLPVERVRCALVESGLSEAVDRRIGGFSRGMLQRLGIASTLIGDPEIVLMDEPCSALDPLGRREILDLIAGQRGQRTVIFSSHILADVQEICDAIGVLRDGRLIYEGPLHQLLIGKGTTGYRLRLRADGAAVAAALRRESWVSGVNELSSNELSVAVTDLATAEQGLVQALARASASVVSLRPEEASLEQVFLEMTR
jgi:ABC-2 type transport system ATP-binding protein